MSRRLLVGVVAAGAVLVLFGRSGSITAQQGGHAQPHFVRIGELTINPSQITVVRDTPDGVTLYFSGSQSFEVKGGDAQAIRRWLDARSDAAAEPRLEYDLDLGRPLDVPSARP